MLSELDTSFLYPDETYSGWSMKDVLDEFLRWAMRQGFSDVKFTPTWPVAGRRDGRWFAVTRGIPDSGDVMRMLEHITRNQDAVTNMYSGRALDRAYEIFAEKENSRSGWIRMRVNATACRGGSDRGASVTLRFIPEKIMSLESQSVPDALLRHFFPHHGLVSISGVMGSGKTTLLAAVMQYIRQHEMRSMMTLEKPIEFDLTRIPNAVGPVEQMEIPGMIQSFEEGVVSSTRKAVDVLLLGETNDRPTMEAMIQAAEVGIAVYHTVHTMSVSAIPSRIIHNFSEEEAHGIAVSFLSSVRLMVQQRLVPKAGGGRIPLREWFAPTDRQRQALIELPLSAIQPELEKMVREHGRSLLLDAQEHFEGGRLPEVEYRRILEEKESGGMA